MRSPIALQTIPQQRSLSHVSHGGDHVPRKHTRQNNISRKIFKDSNAISRSTQWGTFSGQKLMKSTPE